MKILIIASGSQAAEVAERLRDEHRAIPLIAQQTSQSMLEAIQSHRDAALIYLDPTPLEFKGGERLVWATVEEINRVIGSDRKRVILILSWNEVPSSPGQLAEQARRTQVNLIAVGSRDSNQLARLIRNVAVQFDGYSHQFGAIVDPPQKEKAGRSHVTTRRIGDPRGNGHDKDAGVSSGPNSVFALGVTPFVASPPSVLAVEEASETTGQATSDPPPDAPPAPPEPPPDTVSAAANDSPEAPRIHGLELGLLERAAIGAVREFFRILKEDVRRGPRAREVATRASAASPVQRQTTPRAPPPPSSPEAERFTLIVTKTSDPRLADRSPETILVNGVELVTTRRVRKTLEALRATGRCPMSAAGGNGTKGAVQQFLSHTNRSLKPLSLQIGLTGNELRLR